jgi:hypothetical protein
MSATGLDVSDQTLQTTNIQLDEIAATLGRDRQRPGGEHPRAG